ncbi:MAG TPA: hypothetical protein VM537_06695 [Anaerolineae bacterium]|nr:hypothetical protein [Anaerolineae bacterium]
MTKPLHETQNKNLRKESRGLVATINRFDLHELCAFLIIDGDLDPEQIMLRVDELDEDDTRPPTARV